MGLYASTIALSAFLLFLVQPLIAKQILPWFGGSAAVWTTCMVFFQCALLAGYFYADTLVRRCTLRRQAVIHTALLALSLAVLPIVPSEAFKPADGDQPVARILLLLTATIGLPYLMLSTTGPLVQAWFARRYAGGRVYRLYALSNVASMAALIAYPPLIEPLSSVRTQSVAWSLAYALFAVLAAASAWSAVKAAAARSDDGAAPGQPSVPAAAADPAAAASVTPSTALSLEASPGPARQLTWLVLSGLGSVMLLASTTHITQNVASIPFLWVLPLSLYLLTFILCFDGQGWYRRWLFVPLALLLCVAMVLALSCRPTFPEAAPWVDLERSLLPIRHAVPLFALGLFVVCMVLHGELVARKPEASHLTRFYLMVSLGGALGGLSVGLLAPSVLDGYWELPAALVAVPALMALLSRGLLRWASVLALAGASWAAVDYHRYVRDDAVEMSRNFYGTLRVVATAPDTQPGARWRLLHGVIIHGEQIRADDRRSELTTYYGASSGVGRALLGLREAAPGRAQRVGLIGLGVGTLAAYGREGDVYRFYELNPAVVELAQRRFDYLPRSRARVETALGDARLVLEREAPQQFDVLAVDAFSSDSIPVHLITKEAIAVYRRHLRDDGAIAFHISNRYLELGGVVRQLADSIGWTALRVSDGLPSGSELFESEWVVITANPALLARLRGPSDVLELEPPPPGRKPWTDDHNNLFQVLK